MKTIHVYIYIDYKHTEDWLITKNYSLTNGTVLDFVQDLIHNGYQINIH